MLGLIRLKTQFPRPLGDGGNPASWCEPVRLIEWSVGTVDAVVTRETLPRALVGSLRAVCHDLCASGVRGIATSCGFLASVQQEIANQLPVPFVASSLSLIDVLMREGVRLDEIGVLTFDAAALGPPHFAGAGVPVPTAQMGLPVTSHLRQVISHNETRLHLARAQAEVLACARGLKRTFPAVQHLVLECTNLAPYRGAVEAELGVRTYDIRDAVKRLCPMVT